MIDIFRYFIVTIALFGRRKQIKPYGDKTVTIRPPQCKQRKSFLKSMFYMIIDTCKQFYRFTESSRSSTFTRSSLVKASNLEVTLAARSRRNLLQL